MFIIAALLLASASARAAETVPSRPDTGCDTGASQSATLPASGLSILLPPDGCPETPPPPQRPRGPDIFGTVALAVAATPLDARWHAARLSPLPMRGPWTEVMRSAAGRDRDAQVRLVNGWVNNRLGFSNDLRRDDWAPAARSFARGRGDCEDFAIAKLQILEGLGVPRDDLYLVIVRDEARAADHAVLAVRENGALVVLDSRTDMVLRSEAVTDYRPIMSYSSDFAWTHGYPAGTARLRALRTGAGQRRR